MAKRPTHSDLTHGDRALNAAEQIAQMQRDGKALDANALFQVGMQNTDARTQEILQHAQAGLMDGKVDLQGLMKMAGNNLDGSNPASGILRDLGQMDLKGVNAAEMAKVPGMVVDKETGDVNFLGILPVPPQYAKLLAAGYSYFLTHLNGQVGSYAYDLGAKLNDSGYLPAFAKGRMGWAAAYAAMAGTTFWADANQVIQSEKDYTKESAKLANQLGPVLQQIKGRQGVAALFGVEQGENEVIYNARRKMQRTQYAERQRIATQALGRSAAFFASLGTLNKHVNALPSDEAAALQASGGGDAHARIRDQMAKIKDGTNISDDVAYAQARKDLGLDKITAQVESGFGGIFSNPDQMKAFAVVLAGQLAEGVADKWYGQRLKDVPPVSALDMIIDLRKQLDANPRASHFKLPKGVRIEGGKGYDAQNLPLTDYIVQIFEQHERDCHGADGDIPDRLNQDLYKACDVLAKELKAGHMDGLALIRLVGERKVVRDGGRSLVPEDEVKKSIDAMKMTMRHVEWVDPKKYAADANFTLKDVKASWAAAGKDEKQMLVALIPDQVLMAAGVSSGEVQPFRAQNVSEYNAQIAELTQALSKKGAKYLQDVAKLTEQEAAMIADVGHEVAEKGADIVESALPGHGHKDRDITRPLANAVMALSHDGRLAETLGRGAHV